MVRSEVASERRLVSGSRPRFSGCLPVVLAAASLLLPLAGRAAQAEGVITEYETPPRATRMWFPSGLMVVRGIVIQGNPYNGDARFYIENEALRGFARHFGFAVMATAWWGRFQPGEIDIWEEHLAAHAALSGHPELIHAPWAPTGFSNGGQMSYGLNALRPDKVIGFVANKGGYYNDPLPSLPCLLTPGILVAGELDAQFRRETIHQLFTDNRRRGARWAWVEEQGMGHEGDAERLLLPFLARCIELRYPPDQVPTADAGVELIELPEASGWLANTDTWGQALTLILPFDNYPGDQRAAAWLPDAAVAQMYQAFATRTAWLRTGGGLVLDRPLHVETPGPGDYWAAPAGFAMWAQPVNIDTSDYPDWSDIRFFSGATLLARLIGDGQPHDSASVTVQLPAGVHCLSALVTDASGTVRVTDQRHVTVVDRQPAAAVPALSPCMSALAAVALTWFIRSAVRRRSAFRRPPDHRRGSSASRSTSPSMVQHQSRPGCPA